MLLRNLFNRSLAAVTLSGLVFLTSGIVLSQEPKTPGAPPSEPVKPVPDKKTQNKTPPVKAQVITRDNITAEGVVESAIVVNGGREVMNQIRKNGFEHGKRTISQAGIAPVDGTYDWHFKRGDTSEKDQIRMDQQTPQIQYALIYANDENWGLLSGTPFTPRTDILRSFQDRIWHSLDALFRYKEDGSTVTMAGREKHGGVDFYVIDLAHTVKIKADAASAPVDIKLTTRYYVSVQRFRVLWLEYFDDGKTGGVGGKYVRRFYDYRVAQGTLVPFRTVLKRDDEQVEETNVLTVTYGIKLDDSMFSKG